MEITDIKFDNGYGLQMIIVYFSDGSFKPIRLDKDDHFIKQCDKIAYEFLSFKDLDDDRRKEELRQQIKQTKSMLEMLKGQLKDEKENSR